MRYTKRLLATACALLSVLTFGACKDKQTQKQPTQIEEIYAQYVVSVEAQGQTPLSYEEWLASIKGEKGDKGDKGDKVDMPKLQINPITNEWEVSYDNGKMWSSLGVQATGDGTQVQSKLQFQRIAGKDEYRVVGLGMETETDIVIPATYNGLPVTEIGAYAFSVDDGAEAAEVEGYQSKNPAANITSITIPDSVIKVGYRSFAGCINVTNVIIGKEVAMIDSYAFWYCVNLTSIVFQGTVAAWNAIVNEEDWTKVPATEVVCTDGEAALS